MDRQQQVHLTYYRYAGKFLFARIRKRCQECDTTHVVLQRLMAEEFRGKPVSLDSQPWLNNWWKVIWRGAWHAPILLLNGRVFSQGIVPDVPRLLRTVGQILDDEELISNATVYSGKKPAATIG